MKRILVTGVNSYIGNSFRIYMEQFADEYQVDGISFRKDGWRSLNFSTYDCIYHVAGIAHVDVKKATEEEKKLYYMINATLTLEIAKKAKAEGVSQFIFMSSAIVYGDSAPIGKSKIITKTTKPRPANFYGDSKLKAEEAILPLNDENFKVVVLRPPMIYGKGSKGNYTILSKMAQKLPFFPYVENERSMLYIGNLVEIVRLVIKNEESGIFWPQNAEYSKTSELVKKIAEVHGMKVKLVKGFAWVLKALSHVSGQVNKAFGSLCYEQNMSLYKEEYCKYSLSQSIVETEM